jgi:hypothetical protein
LSVAYYLGSPLEGSESFLPFSTPSGRRIEYLREPIADHSVPTTRETMARLLAAVDQALAADHVVYLHCRAGIGRSRQAVECEVSQEIRLFCHLSPFAFEPWETSRPTVIANRKGPRPI